MQKFTSVLELTIKQINNLTIHNLRLSILIGFLRFGFLMPFLGNLAESSSQDIFHR